METTPRLMLSDEEWQRIEPHLRGRPCDPGGHGRNNRLFVEGVLWILRTGSPWRDLPSYFGRWFTVYRRFRRFCKAGLWESMMKTLKPEPSEADGIVMIDSTVIRAHQHAAGAVGGQGNQALGRSRGGFSTKLHVVVNAAAVVRSYAVTGGEAADIRSAPTLLEGLPDGTRVLADKGYDSDALVRHIEDHKSQPVIPPRSNRKQPRSYDTILYRARNCIERYFARLKQFRRLATRYDKTSVSFCGFFGLANSLLLA